MARAGILYSDVAKATAKLIEEGKNPTVDSVRDALGSTGSKSTIAPLLKRWKVEHQGEIAQAEVGLPPSLLAAVKGLHQHMQAEFAQQLEQAKQQQTEALRAAAEREQQLRTERDAALATNTALKDELVGARESLARLQESHHAQSVALATAQSDNAGLQQRLADRAAEIAALDRQLSQARSQFEHYQEATAAQRADERQDYEQRIARLEQNLAAANRQVASQQAMLGQQEARISHLAADHVQQQQATRDAQEELVALRSERDRLAVRLEETTVARQHLAAQMETMQTHLADTRITLVTREQEAAMLTDQLRRTEGRADRLAEEKYMWLQERATLMEQLRHVSSLGGGTQPITDPFSPSDRSG